MRTLVTGGAGFLGSHLCDELLSRGHSVESLDDHSTGQRENLAHLSDSEHFIARVGDIRDEALLEEVLEDVDTVFHLAAVVGMQHVLDNPLRTLDVNIHGTSRLLEKAAKHEVRVVLASTSEVYGRRTDIPFQEEDPPTWGPVTSRRWWYALAKATDEAFGQAYQIEEGLDFRVARLFNTIGPRQTGEYGMVVPRFVRAALRDEPLTVYGDGTQRRSFAWVKDVVRGIADLGEIPDEQAEGAVVNLGAREDISIKGLAKKVIRLTGSSSEIQFIPFEKAYGSDFEETPVRVPDLTRAKQLLDYEPTMSLESSLERIIEWEQSRLEGEAREGK